MTSDQFKPTPAAYKNRRGWLIAFGVIEILIACFSLLVVLLVLVLPHLGIPKSTEQASMSPSTTISSVVLCGVLAAVFLAIGVGSIRCKNWARIAMLVMSGLWLGIGVVSTLVFLLVGPSIIRQQVRNAPEVRRTSFVVTTAKVGLYMVVIPAVFLVFHTRKSVKATCLSLGAGQVPATTTMVLHAPKVPVPVIILAIWEVLGFLYSVYSFPEVKVAVVFGAVLHRLAAILVVLVFSALSGSAAWLIYRRKLLGWGIAMFNAVFWIASTVTTCAGLDMLQMYREMGLSEQQQMQAVHQYGHSKSIILVVGLPALTAHLAFLLYAKKFFSWEGTGAASGSLPS